MPTVLRSGGFMVMIYTRDHPPPHVHIFHGGDEVVINLQPVEVREASRMKNSLIRKALELVEENQGFLLSEWTRIGPIP